MVTVKDVAREVGLSVTTVSRALNGYDDVAPHTRERIRATALALDYHPNQAARSLQTKRANAIGLTMPVVHRTYDSFWLDFIGGVAGVCAEHGIDLLLSMTDGAERPPRGLARLAGSRRVDGLLMCDIEISDARIEYLRQQRLPFVAFGRTLGPQDYSYIDVDGAAGTREAVSLLIDLGHRHIAYLGVSPKFGFSAFRLLGYREALLHAGIEYDEHLVHEDLTVPRASLVVARLLDLPTRPTAIFAAADYLALAALKGAQSAGLHVPSDMSVVVFDDSLVVEQAFPPLTSVHQPNRRLGEEAAELLLNRIEQSSAPPVQRLVEPSLVQRMSTAPPRGFQLAVTVAQ